MERKNPKKMVGSAPACAPSRALASPSLLPLSFSFSLFLLTIPFLSAIPPVKKSKAGAHAAFPKRRVLLQDSSSSSSTSGGGNGSGSSTSFSNTVTGAEDSPDRVEASPAVALAESPLSDAELCAVSKQVNKKKNEERRTKNKKKKHIFDGGHLRLSFSSHTTTSQPPPKHKIPTNTHRSTAPFPPSAPTSPRSPYAPCPSRSVPSASRCPWA